MVKVKICGITNFEDASSAAALGADYLGFIFFKGSARNVSLKTASDILKKLPPVFESVGVFVDETVENILKIVKKCGLKNVQLHGAETPEFCERLRNSLASAGLPQIKIIKAFRVKDASTLEQVPPFAGKADFILLDSYVEGIEGGTGDVFNWELAVDAKKYGIDIFLSGGLTPENVCDAVDKVMPFAVDVSSGVERLPRRKDFDKLKRFITSLK